MNTSSEVSTLLDGFEITLENNDAYETLQGLYYMKIAGYSSAFQNSKSGVEREALGGTLCDLISARDLLNGGRPETLELGHLLLKHISEPLP